MKKIIVLLLICHFSFGQKIGGGDLNPGIYTNQKAIEKFQNMRLGVSIHWGPNSVGGKEISWSRGVETSQAEYDNFYKSFNPTKFNADEWVKIIDAFGAKYVTITTKHHDGFSMWHSDFSEYDIEATPFKRDILKELSEACKKKGVVFGTYYSSLDWYHPDYPIEKREHGAPGALFPKNSDSPNMNRYFTYMKNQINELITKYNTQIIQFDGDWDPNWTHAVGSDMYLYIRKLNDNILVNNRTDKGRHPNGTLSNAPWNAQIFAGDFEERERLTASTNDDGTGQINMLGKASYPWQAWVTLDNSQWSWKPNFKFRSSEDVVIDFLKTIGDGGNYFINIGPRPDGTFEKSAVDIITKAGVWIKKHADAIYGTKGGPFVFENKYTSTVKGKIINLFVFDNSINKITLKETKKLKSIVDDNGKIVKFSQVNNEIIFDIDASKNFVKYYKLILN